MLKKLEHSPFIHAFQRALLEESSLLFEELWECPKAILALMALQSLNRSVIIITQGEGQNKLLDDLNYFSQKECFEFLPWETLPSEDIPPSLDIVGKRLETLYHLGKEKKRHLVVTNLQGCLQKILPKENLLPLCHMWKVGTRLDFSKIEEILDSLGYTRNPITSDKGHYSLRGGIVDIFPVSALSPYRIEFFDDVIDRIRTFDPLSQKSIEKTNSVFITPANEMHLIKSAKKLVSLLDYFEEPPILMFDDLLMLEDKYISLKKLPGSSSHHMLDVMDLLAKAPCKRLFFTSHPLEKLSPVIASEKKTSAFYSGKNPFQGVIFEMFNTSISSTRMHHPFVKIDTFFLPSDPVEDIGEALFDGIKHNLPSSFSLHFITSTEAEEHTLKRELVETGIEISSNMHFDRGYLTSGCLLLDSHMVYLPYTEFSHRYKVRRKKWRNSYHTPAAEFHELTPGDLVVHFHNGVGKFLGIEKQKNHLGHIDEFIILEYANSSKLYVPLTQAHLVTRYIGSKETAPPLYTLGTTKWQTAKLKAEQSIMGYAQDLLQMQAEREAKGGFVYRQDSDDVILFEEEFPFVETEDQLRAIAHIKEDMCSGKAMDRLICGDVGYGKTEVAMRAAFKAVIDGNKQVAVLVPTTTLAMQHFDTFKERMSNFPIRIKALSRFISAKESLVVLEELKNGEIDILIGTHRLISKDVAFKNLGLLIIDEEQRFGVRAKETLKKLKVGVDCLTLSATPIPRTLHMSIVGAKDLSVINSPPQDRLPIKTIMAETEDVVIKNALLRELARDGQAYFIHNRVESIDKKQEYIQNLVPTARTKIVHGQMDPQEIDDIFHAFKTGQVDVLLATTLIESGIDIPNANTIIIDRADTFGLADLYQMRGRVGRWNKPAYAYFLTPKNKELSEIARKRLQALIETSGFGGGMKLAMLDLEIRGAGDILGVQQSGQVSTVGFHLYCKLLKRAVDALKHKKTASFIETKMEFNFPASLPDTYIPERSVRLELYHRLGEASQLDTADALLAELEDRFGKPPEEVVWLYHLTRMRIFASHHDFSLLKFEKLSFTAHRQEKKELIKKSVFLPQFDKPSQLEEYVVMMLKHQFKLQTK